MKTALLLATAVLAAAPALAAPRERLRMDAGWRFHLGHATDPTGDFGYGQGTWFAKAGEQLGATAVTYDTAGWRTVNVPHDWAVELPFVAGGSWEVVSHGSKPLGRAHPETSVGWYRRNFVVPESDRGRRLSIAFDGVFRDSMVWVNGHYMGRHASGYTPFQYDITDVVNFGADNVVTVRADATQFEGWFYEGAGIYRHVWLNKTDPLHIAPHGVFVSTDGIGERSTVTARAEVENEGDAPQRFHVAWTIRDQDGRSVASATSPAATLAPGQRTTVTRAIAVRAPRLWSLESPHRYTLTTTLRRENGDADTLETRFGVRSIRFDADRGFLLNGKPVKLKGTCNHQDHAGVGAALPDAVQDFRIRRLKAMGGNAYRTSHNPPTPELLEACDRLGMLVMDEHRVMGTSPEMLADLDTLVRRDRNHPSVILWSIGNEENAVQGTEIGARLAVAMQRRVKALDPTRPCTLAMNGGWGQGASPVVDVMGFNYGNAAGLDAWRAAHPRQPAVGTETASTLSTRGEYADDPARGFVQSYDVREPGWGARAETWWNDYAARPWLSGGFAWTGFDYRGEPTPYGWPNISSQFGILDTCGFPKDNFYYYKAWWGAEPVVHLLPHWNWPGREGQETLVWVHSNAERVELFLNGRSLGAKEMPRLRHLEWRVPYEAGVLEARGYQEARTVATHRVETTGAPAAVRLEPDRRVVRADGEDVAMVTFSIHDASGRRVPVAGDDVRFDIRGGRILGVGNGNPASHEADTFFATPTVLRLDAWKYRAVDATENRPETAPAYDDAGWESIGADRSRTALNQPSSAVFRQAFDGVAANASGPVRLSFEMIDDDGWVYLNGRLVGEAHDWRRGHGFDAGAFLVPGRNVLAVVVRNGEGPGGVSGARLVSDGPAPRFHRRAFNGLGQVIVQAGRTAGPITLTATAAGLTPATLTLEAAPATPRPSVP